MSNTTAPPGPPGVYQPQPPPRKKRHRVRNTLLVILGIIVLLIVIAVVTAPKGNKTAAGTTAGTTTAAPATSAAPAPTAAVLPPGQAKFVAAIRSGLGKPGYSNTGTDAQIARIGVQACKIRSNGGSQSDLVTALAGVRSAWVLSPAKVARAAEKAICPSYLPVPPHVLIRFSGNGIRNSAPFLVSAGTVTVRYSYDCSALGSSGNFIADMVNGNQSSLSSDDQSIANALGNGGSQTTTLYPTNVGSDYHLEVNSECNWSIVVTG